MHGHIILSLCFYIYIYSIKVLKFSISISISFASLFFWIILLFHFGCCCLYFFLKLHLVFSCFFFTYLKRNRIILFLVWWCLYCFIYCLIQVFLYLSIYKTFPLVTLGLFPPLFHQPPPSTRQLLEKERKKKKRIRLTRIKAPNKEKKATEKKERKKNLLCIYNPINIPFFFSLTHSTNFFFLTSPNYNYHYN